jgi:ferredoxin-NADP reductase
MAGAALLGRLSWLAARVTDVTIETPRVRTVHLEAPGWPGHRPGQHVDIRLTAEDGYQAQRSYSIANAADGERVLLTVERVDDGEVSPFIVDELRPGDRFELRGPIGGYFVWSPENGGPLQLVGGGSGVVPLMAMIRARAGSQIPTRLLYSARAIDELIFLKELEALDADTGLEVTYTLTRARPSGWEGFDRRVDRAMLEEVTWPADRAPLVFVCGPTGFVEMVATTLVSLGHPPERVRTERFGPTGGSQ